MEIRIFQIMSQAVNQTQALLGAGFHAITAENAAEAFKLPLFGLPGDSQRIGRTFAGAHAAENTIFFVDHQLAALAGERFALFCRIVPRNRTFDQIAENIFEN